MNAPVGFAAHPEWIRRDFTRDERIEAGRKGGLTGAAGRAHRRKARERAVSLFRQALFGTRLDLTPEEIAAVEQLAVVLAEASWVRGYAAGQQSRCRRSARTDAQVAC